MPIQILDEGDYELFETTNQNEILVLNGRDWFSIVQGQAGEIIVRTDSDHRKDHTIRRGSFRLVDFRDDPKFRDQPHLFLEDRDRYEEAVLPNGLPTDADKQKKIVRMGDRLPAGELDGYLEHPREAGPGAERQGRPGGGSLANVVHYLEGIGLPARRGQLIGHARRKKAPREVLEQLEGLADRPYGSMADVTRGIGEAKEPLPVEDYDDLGAEEIPTRLEGLAEDELRRIRDHEASRLARKTVLRAIDERLDLTRRSLPIHGYEQMSADEIQGHLDRLDEEELREVRSYEERHRARKTVLRAVDRRLEE